jgi:hypothetical protein
LLFLPISPTKRPEPDLPQQPHAQWRKSIENLLDSPPNQCNMRLRRLYMRRPLWHK